MANSEGGYDYELVDTPPDTLICKICHYPSREPHLTLCCGHTFCNSCLQKAKKSTILSDACPMCRKDGFTSVPNKQNERAVLSLRIRCTNTESGCGWIGEMFDITGHLQSSSGCKFQEVECSNSCGKILQRHYLADHVDAECPCRRIGCPYCNLIGEYQFIDGRHKEECSEFPTPCPNHCGIDNIPSKCIEGHRKECPLEVVQCQYHNVGCEAKMTRKEMIEHDQEKMGEHLLLMKSAFIDAQVKLADSQAKLADSHEKLADAHKKLANNQEKLQIELAGVQENLEHSEGKLELRFLGVLGNLQYSDDKLADIEQNTEETEARITDLESALEEKTKLMDVLFSEWLISLHTRAAQLLSGNQSWPVFVKMPNFAMNMTNCVEWYSTSFYTHQGGYKLQLKVCPDGIDAGDGTDMSVFMYRMAGVYDGGLPKLLKGTYKVTLMNQICDSWHHSASCKGYATRGYSKAFWRCEKFISHHDLERITATCQFVKDDCVIFEVREVY